MVDASVVVSGEAEDLGEVSIGRAGQVPTNRLAVFVTVHNRFRGDSSHSPIRVTCGPYELSRQFRPLIIKRCERRFRPRSSSPSVPISLQ